MMTRKVHLETLCGTQQTETGGSCARSGLPRRWADKSRSSGCGPDNEGAWDPSPRGPQSRPGEAGPQGQGGSGEYGAGHTPRRFLEGCHPQSSTGRPRCHGRACTPSQPAADAAENKAAVKQGFSDQEIVIEGTAKDIPHEAGWPRRNHGTQAWRSARGQGRRREGGHCPAPAPGPRAEPHWSLQPGSADTVLQQVLAESTTST